MDSPKANKRKSIAKNNIVASVIYGIIVGFTVIFLLTVIISSISLKFKNPIDYISGITLFCLIMGGLCCGMVSSASYKPNGLISSAISSGIIGLIILLAGFNNNSGSILNLIINPLVVLIFGISGGLIIHKGKGKRKIKKYIK